MIPKRFTLTFFIIILYTIPLYSQVDPTLIEEEIELKIHRALDHFNLGNYNKALEVLGEILDLDPQNERAKDLIISIKEIYIMEKNDSESDPDSSDFDMDDPLKNDTSGNENEKDIIGKPDFSVIDEEIELLDPKKNRNSFEFSLAPNFILPWTVGDEAVVFPNENSYSTSVKGTLDYYFNTLDRIFGVRGAYTLFLLNLENKTFASSQLHVVDVLFTFRTYFNELIDSSVIFKISMGYRGYFANDYTFYQINRDYLNGFNMEVSLEAPLLYLLWGGEVLKRIYFDVHMNLLFFPDLNSLNLFDFKIKGAYRADSFSLGAHFGAYSVITPEEVKYLWMMGITFNLYL